MRPVSTSTTRVLLGDGGESASCPPRFFRALPSPMAVAAAGALLLLVFLGAARGEVAFSSTSPSVAASAAASSRLPHDAWQIRRVQAE
jgi:hypothetical protein